MRKIFIAALLAGGIVAASAVAAETITGPSSAESPYVVPSQAGVVTKSILTVGDSVHGYRMVGIPDGLGAYRSKGGDFTLFMNHELSGTGVVRAHGAKGAFVSQWSIDRHDLAVKSGSDLIQQIATYDPATGGFAAPAKGVELSRLCSANLPEPSAFYDRRSKLGYDGRLFMDGEEKGPGGPRLRPRGERHELRARGARQVLVGELRRQPRHGSYDGRCRH